MAKARTLVGLDVHATKIVAAVLDAETGELQFFGSVGDVGEAAGLCAGLPRPVRAAYEAGPTGYGLARELAASWRGVRGRGAEQDPARVGRSRQDRSPRRRACWSGCCWRASCTRSACPGAEEEALRDLVRAREAVRVDLMRCRHRLSKLLLRHGIRFDDGPRVDGAPPRLAGRHRAAAGRPRRPRCSTPAAPSTRSCTAATQLEREIVALLPGLAVAGPGRAAALPARDRHADRRRAVLRDRRLRALRARRAADELRRAGPLRGHHRPAAPARRDHQDRLRPRPPAAGRGRLALPPAPGASARR